MAQETEINKKIIIHDDDIKPLKPYINDCCYKPEIDLVPSSERKSGHLNTLYQKTISEVPKENNVLRDGSRLKGYDVVEKSGESKMRSNNPDLKMYDSVPRNDQTQKMVVSDEGRIVEMIPRDAKVFIRKIKTNENPKIPSTERINGEGSFGRTLMLEIPKDQNPLKNGTYTKGYDWIASVEYFGKMLDFVDRPFSEIPREPFMSNRGKTSFPVEPVPANKNGFLDCR